MGKKSRRGKPKTRQKGGGARAAAGGPVARAPAAAAGSPAAADTTTFAPLHGAQAPAVVPSSDTPTTLPPPAPLGAACWICLDGDPDDGGKPIVRDCSCRGDDAGFAHLSCLIKYAGSKTRELMEANAEDGLNEPWVTCPNCRRDYQRHVAIGMAKALILFLDEIFPGFGITAEMYALAELYALSRIIYTIYDMDYKRSSELRDEGKRAADKIISVVHESNATDKISMHHLRDAHVALAKYAEAEETKYGYETALDYYAKALGHSKSLGDEESTAQLEAVLEKVKSLRDCGREEPFTEQQIQVMRAQYKKNAREKGEGASDTIYSGITFLQALQHSNRHGLEFERSASKLAAISRRVNGPEHQITKQVEEGLALSRARHLWKVKGNDVVGCHVLRISDDGKKYVVKEIRSLEDEGRIAEVAFGDDYRFAPGTPVVCHGLENAARLNGKLGDIRSFDKDAGRYVVRFEDKRLKTVLVKPANVRIVFELPDEQQG